VRDEYLAEVDSVYSERNQAEGYGLERRESDEQ